ncbi:hypothetical protein GCM10009789_70270 [Kribbella sancticallisti]|uniref:Uncharacterized protein n=1 Tax=Kribbella sancticallisti TaxID=460087 RepID=A0ABP4QBN1_9ACTN
MVRAGSRGLGGAAKVAPGKDLRVVLAPGTDVRVVSRLGRGSNPAR